MLGSRCQLWHKREGWAGGPWTQLLGIMQRCKSLGSSPDHILLTPRNDTGHAHFAKQQCTLTGEASLRRRRVWSPLSTPAKESGTTVPACMDSSHRTGLEKEGTPGSQRMLFWKERPLRRSGSRCASACVKEARGSRQWFVWLVRGCSGRCKRWRTSMNCSVAFISITCTSHPNKNPSTAPAMQQLGNARAHTTHSQPHWHQPPARCPSLHGGVWIESI